jgi:hypothetical protein
LLEKGRRVYQKLAQNGAEFINHGYIAHASYCHKVRRYISTHFYDELTRDMIVDDIRRGHLTYESVLGKTPNGFRVPHFGTFQRSEQLNYLHRILEVMGYAYSSSTVPYYGFRNGPVHQTASTLKEIPVSGCYDNPLRILDSWSYSYLPERTCYEGEYEVELATMVRFFQEPSQAGLLNFYADPSHIYDSQEFFEVIKLAVPIALNSYKRLLETLAEGERGDG